MRFRWLVPVLLLVTVASAVVRYDMPKEELLKELGKPTSVLMKGKREVLIYPNNVRIEIEQGKVVSVKGIDLAAAEQAAANAPAEAAPADPKAPAAPAAEEEDAGPKLTPEQQKAAAEAEAKLEKEMAAADAKARAELEKSITELENLGSQPEKEPEPSFNLVNFLLGLVVKWLLMLAALKLTCKYWNADVDWSGLMLAAAVDTGVRAVVLGIGAAMGMFSVFYADEALGALALVLILRKVSTNQSLQQAVTITMTSKVFSVVVGSAVMMMLLAAMH